MAFLFARRGAIVVLCDSRETGNSETKKLMSMINHECRVYSYECDISKRSEVERLIKTIQHEIGDITVLVNNGW